MRRISFCFFLPLACSFVLAKNIYYPYQKKTEKLLVSKQSQNVLNFVNRKLRHNITPEEYNLLLCYKVEALMDFELYTEAIFLSENIINSASSSDELKLRTHILRELNYEILENFPLANIELEKAEKILRSNPPLKPEYYLNFLVRKSSLMRLTVKPGYEKIAQEAILYHSISRNKNHLSSAYLLMGIFYRTRDYQKAIYYFEQAKKQSLEIGDYDGYIGRCIVLSDLHFSHRFFQKAKSNLEVAFMYINRTNQNSTKAWLLQKKSDFFAFTKNYDSAYINLKKSKEYDDIYNFKLKKLKLKELDYQKENIKQKKISSNAIRNSRKLLTILILCIVMVAILGYLAKKINNNNVKIRKQKILIEGNAVKLEKLVDNRTYLLKELNHRIKNNFAIILSLIKIQKDDLEDLKAKEKLEDLYGRVYTISLAQDLYKYNFDSNETKFLNLKNFFIDIIQSISASNERFAKFDLQAENHLTVNTEVALPIGLIFNELLINSYKHAKSEENQAIEIFIMLQKIKNQISFSYHDNGTYFKEKSRIDGLGILLIDSMVKQLDGQIERKNFNYKITF